jgi:peroxin-1
VISVQNWEGRILVKLQWIGNKDGVVLAWSGDRSQRPDRVEIGNDLAACLLLSSETDVEVSIIPSAAVHQATRVLVEPSSADDWEILSLHAAFLEDQLINQVAVLHQDMSLPLWINTSTMIRIHVKETKPHHTVHLVAGSEIIVAPKPRVKQGSSAALRRFSAHQLTLFAFRRDGRV